MTKTEARELERILLSKFKKLSSKDISLIMHYKGGEIRGGKKNEKEIYKKEDFKSTGNKIGEFTKDELELVSLNSSDAENIQLLQDENIDSELGDVSELEKAIQFINDNALETEKLWYMQHYSIKRI